MNTLNLCIGHLPFPEDYAHHVDQMISPEPISFKGQLIHIPDALYGQYGHGLSEYSAILWVGRFHEVVLKKYQYVRFFQYRRFTSLHLHGGNPATNQVSVHTIKLDELHGYAKAFDRQNQFEWFNLPVQYLGGMMMQFAISHQLPDLYYFTKFLVKESILTKEEAHDFIMMDILIPATSNGVYLVSTFLQLVDLLERASHFMYTAPFVQRSGYQRRTMGFLLERLGSYWVAQYCKRNPTSVRLGYNIIINDSTVIDVTNYKPVS